jgi:hypothetical protein
MCHCSTKLTVTSEARVEAGLGSVGRPATGCLDLLADLVRLEIDASPLRAKQVEHGRDRYPGYVLGDLYGERATCHHTDATSPKPSLMTPSRFAPSTSTATRLVHRVPPPLVFLVQAAHLLRHLLAPVEDVAPLPGDPARCRSVLSRSCRLLPPRDRVLPPYGPGRLER